jgi:hypothetical protein
MLYGPAGRTQGDCPGELTISRQLFTVTSFLWSQKELETWSTGRMDVGVGDSKPRRTEVPGLPQTCTERCHEAGRRLISRNWELTARMGTGTWILRYKDLNSVHRNELRSRFSCTAATQGFSASTYSLASAWGCPKADTQPRPLSLLAARELSCSFSCQVCGDLLHSIFISRN